MISSSIKWAAHAAYLTSDRLITPDNSLSSEFKPKLRDALFDYQNHIETKLRNEDVALLIELYKLGYDTFSVNQQLSSLATYFLEWQGNRFEVKPKLLDEWLNLLALIDGSWVIAQAYVDLIKDHNISVDDVITCVSLHQCMIALCKGSSHKQYADNHVHMGGHGHAGASLLNFALYFESSSQSVNWPRRSEYTFFESGRYNKNDLQGGSHYSVISSVYQPLIVMS
ncbi:hypothetical protein [Photobacterium sanguinicancri]|uniref:hypothetical protein n=1 Tax=Photobacterium sanguinicancri TaxID=875932 RepID=UPI000786D064|nr:hypothetical protein [Photobacterium sanguinicancri]KXI21035.1 hypothetical protein AS132_23110 [Photobacterium sanguinicancri]